MITINCLNKNKYQLYKTMILQIQNIFSDSGNIVFPIVRILLGVILFFQAYDKIFRIKLPNVLKEIDALCTERGVPKWFANFSTYISSYLELVYGALLILGLFTIPALYIIGIHLVIVSLAFSFLKGVWDMKHVFPRIVMVVFLLMIPQEWNIFSLDSLLQMI